MEEFLFLYESKNDLTFVRYGGLSSVKQKGFKTSDTYHSPPAKKGIYAFVYPYIDKFMLSGSKDFKGGTDKFKEKPRKFQYNGDIWHHLEDFIQDKSKIIKKSKEWVLTDMETFKEAFRVMKIVLNKEILGDDFYDIPKNSKNAWKKYSKDHLEVFITGKI